MSVLSLVLTCLISVVCAAAILFAHSLAHLFACSFSMWLFAFLFVIRDVKLWELTDLVRCLRSFYSFPVETVGWSRTTTGGVQVGFSLPRGKGIARHWIMVRENMRRSSNSLVCLIVCLFCSWIMILFVGPSVYIASLPDCHSCILGQAEDRISIACLFVYIFCLWASYFCGFSELGLVVQGVAHWFGQACKRDVGAGPFAYTLAHLLAPLALLLYIFPMLSAPYIARVASALRCVYFFAHLFACSLLSSWDGVGFDVPVLSCFEP